MCLCALWMCVVQCLYWNKNLNLTVISYKVIPNTAIKPLNSYILLLPCFFVGFDAWHFLLHSVSVEGQKWWEFSFVLQKIRTDKRTEFFWVWTRDEGHKLALCDMAYVHGIGCLCVTMPSELSLLNKQNGWANDDKTFLFVWSIPFINL